MLSSKAMSGEAGRASSNCSSVSTSISTTTPPCSSENFRAAASTSGMPRSFSSRNARWLSLIRMASNKPRRWLVPPPHRTAYFCRSRYPGSVLRVSRMTALVPLTSSVNWLVSVATPLRCVMKFSAVRSPESSERTEPVIDAITEPGARTSPSFSFAFHWTSASISSNTI